VRRYPHSTILHCAKVSAVDMLKVIIGATSFFSPFGGLVLITSIASNSDSSGLRYGYGSESCFFPFPFFFFHLPLATLPFPHQALMLFEPFMLVLAFFFNTDFACFFVVPIASMVRVVSLPDMGKNLKGLR
jgi:hypothetical protein